MDNFYYKKFKDKTDKELKNILKEKENYTSEAIIASYKILKERNLVLEEFAAIENDIKKLESVKENQKEAQAKNPETAKTKDLELYSKKTILGFSIFFSTIFGVVLLVFNMQQVNSQKGKNQVIFFGIAYFIFTIIIVQLFKTSPMLGLLFNLLGATILNEYFWNKFIGKDIAFQKRNWLKPALIFLTITATIFLFAFYILK
jgi:hypothetical protein